MGKQYTSLYKYQFFYKLLCDASYFLKTKKSFQKFFFHAGDFFLCMMLSRLAFVPAVFSLINLFLLLQFLQTNQQDWEFALLLICSSLFCSKLLKLKSDREQFAQVAHNKRTTVSRPLMLLLTKNDHERFGHVPLLLRAT